MGRHARTEKKIPFIVQVAVVVIATLQQAWDHSTYITDTMTAIATTVVQATLTLTTIKTREASSRASSNYSWARIRFSTNRINWSRHTIRCSTNSIRPSWYNDCRCVTFYR